MNMIKDHKKISVREQTADCELQAELCAARNLHFEDYGAINLFFAWAYFDTI